jgi:hypothetical protein
MHAYAAYMLFVQKLPQYGLLHLYDTIIIIDSMVIIGVIISVSVIIDIVNERIWWFGVSSTYAT